MAALVGAVVGVRLLANPRHLPRDLDTRGAIHHRVADRSCARHLGRNPSVNHNVPRPTVFGFDLRSPQQFYFFLAAFVALAIVAALNLGRTRVGRAFIAIRDQDIAAEIMGINIARYKLTAFMISSFYAGVAGVLYAYFLGVANYEQFQIGVSIDYLAMIIIGGLGSVRGSILGAIFVTVLPLVVRECLEAVGSLFAVSVKLGQYIPQLRLTIFGALIIAFLVAEPDGLNKLWISARSSCAGDGPRNDAKNEDGGGACCSCDQRVFVFVSGLPRQTTS